MARKLKIWNGRFISRPKDGKDSDLWDKFREVHAYVCAHSRADARRVIEEYCGYDIGDSEIKVYWSEGCWGNTMEGIEPERGLWLNFGGWHKDSVLKRVV